jgi:ribonuclease D
LKNFFNKLSFYFLPKKEIYLIESDEDKIFVQNCLEEESLIGLDTEFDWRTTYFPKLSLLQISTESKILLIDCIKCKDLKYLKKILENPNTLVIFHSSRSDTTVLNTNLNIKVQNVFDIQIAEKKFHGGDIKNYGAIVKKYFSIDLDKSETNSNWLKRPFSQNQLTYAADDVAFLIKIYKKQLKMLNKLNLTKEVFRDSGNEASSGNQDLSVSRLKKLKRASKLQKDIFSWRENYASKKNIPPSHIFKDKHLKDLAKEVNSQNIDIENLSTFFKDRKSIDIFLDDMKL